MLQVASWLASLFTPALVGRWIAGLLAPAMLGHGVLVLVGLEGAIQASLAGSISEITGIAGASSQLQFIAEFSETYLWIGYLFALGLNLVVLVSKAFLKLEPPRKAEATKQFDDAGDLWESQK